MRVRSYIFFYCFLVLFCTPFSAFADTIVDAGTVISEDITWTKAGSPYLVQGGITIDQGATLSIEPGVVVQFYSSGMHVFGRLIAAGTSDEPILFTSDAIGWYGINFFNQEVASSLDYVTIKYASTAIFGYYSKDLSISNTKVEDSSFGIYVYGSHFSVQNFSVENIFNGAIGMYKSDATLKDITLKNVHSGIELYVDSKADISNLFIDNPYYEALGLYERSSVHVASSTLINGYGDAIGVYGGSTVDMRDSVISGFIDGAGIADYEYWPSDLANSLSLVNNDIHDNETGISMYSQNSSYVISDNSIHDNILYGFELYGTGSVNISNNFWGDPSGPYNDPSNLTGTGNEILWYDPEGSVTFSPWLTSWGAPPVSNVLFLPGIESSRLYRPDYNGGTDQLWEPNIDDDVKDLYMNPDGTGVRNDVYTKERDVLDELPNGANIYKSFIAKMDELRTSGAITDWEPIAYDWRLSLDDILSYGNDVQGRVYYSGDLRATSTPYVIQELKRLAASSKTHRVTIVAHSNGGLLAKRLTELLGPAESARLIDKMIFVAVPQAGTPMAIPAGLHGYEQDHVLGLVTSESTARTFAENSPMEYQLLPSANYFTYVDDPVVTFDPSLTDWISRYGSTIHSESSLRTFLTDTYGRVDPQTGDINQPIQFNSSLLSDTETLHASLDNWTPPASVQLTQIAGWGVPKTVKVVAYKKKGTGVKPEADFTIDGDGTVVVPSALWTSTTASTTNYWVDLKQYNTLGNRILGLRLKTDHASILEISELLTFITDNLLAHSIDSLPQYISTSIPTTDAHDIRLRYALHSPLTLNLYDDQGRHTGVSTTTGQVEEQIPGTYYTEFGDVKYLFSDASGSAHIIMDGYAPGTFTFNIDQYTGDNLTASTTFKDIPTTAETMVNMNVQSDISTLSPMQIDKNGDGTIDVTLAPKLGDTVTLDTTPPELQLTFSTTTRALAFIGTDPSNSSGQVRAVTITATTTYPVLKKNQKEKEKESKGVTTTTVTARDEAGNTTVLIYTERLSSPEKFSTISLEALSYNGATTTLSSTAISYKWRVNKSGSFSLFASSLHAATTTLESHYRPKKNTTVIMTRPQELDDSDNDDDSDVRPTKRTLPGMVIPYMMTKQGSLIINY